MPLAKDAFPPPSTAFAYYFKSKGLFFSPIYLNELQNSDLQKGKKTVLERIAKPTFSSLAIHFTTESYEALICSIYVLTSFCQHLV